MRKPIWQDHHLEYDPPKVVRIRKGIHGICTRIKWFKFITEDERYAINYELNKKPKD